MCARWRVTDSVPVIVIDRVRDDDVFVAVTALPGVLLRAKTRPPDERGRWTRHRDGGARTVHGAFERQTCHGSKVRFDEVPYLESGEYSTSRDLTRLG